MLDADMEVMVTLQSRIGALSSKVAPAWVMPIAMMILPKQHVRDPAWLSWKAHVAMFELALSPSFSEEEIIELDDLITTHQELYAKVPNYT